MAKRGSEIMCAGRGNSRKELIEELRQGMARVSVSSQVRYYQTACPLSADRHNLCWLFDTVCHFHACLFWTIILNFQLIPDLSIRQIAFIPGELNYHLPLSNIVIQSNTCRKYYKGKDVVNSHY